jgi:hypothetical protein
VRITIAILTALVWTNGSWAADSSGKFRSGGGVGSSPCPAFLNALATGRQLGGAAGAKVIDPYLQYVLGFQTGFNFEAEGVYDIFGSLPDYNVLYAIEPWCTQNPDKPFSNGLLDLANNLRKKLKQN